MEDRYQRYSGKTALVLTDRNAYIGRVVGSDEVFLNLERAGCTTYDKLADAIKEYKSMSEGPKALLTLDVRKDKIEAVSCIDKLVE